MASSAVTVLVALLIASSSASGVRGFCRLMDCLIFENASSIGLNSGEYGGINRYDILWLSRKSLTFLAWCTGRLSMIRVLPFAKMSSKYMSRYATNHLAVMAPLCKYSASMPFPVRTATVLILSPGPEGFPSYTRCPRGERPWLRFASRQLPISSRKTQFSGSMLFNALM